MILAGLLGFLATFLTPVVTHPQEKPVELPPIYITQPEIPNCDPAKQFPQMVLLPQFAEASQIQHMCESFLSGVAHNVWRQKQKSFGCSECYYD